MCGSCVIGKRWDDRISDLKEINDNNVIELAIEIQSTRRFDVQKG